MSPRLRRSRIAWPGPMSRAGVEPGHTHDWPEPLIERIRFLTRGFIIVGLSLVAIVVLVMLLIFQRSDQRDRQTDRVQREIRDSWCQALDGQPQDDPFLDPLRERYGCGPGLAADRFTPDQQERLQGRAPAVRSKPSPTSTPARPTPPMGSGAVLNPPRPTENPVPKRPESAPEPSASPSPLVDLGPVTDRVCDALGVCL